MRVAVWTRKNPTTKRISFYLRWSDPTTGILYRPALHIVTSPKPSKAELQDCRDRAEALRVDKQRQIEGTPHGLLIPMRLHDARDGYAEWMQQDFGEGVQAAPGTQTNALRAIGAFLGYLATREAPRRLPLFIGTVCRHDVALWRDSLRLKGLKADTINHMLASLSGWCAWALDYGHSHENPVTLVGKLKVQARRAQLPIKTPEDFWGLVAKLGDPLKRGAVIILGATGLRQGVVRAIRHRQIDLDTRTLTIPKAHGSSTKMNPPIVPLARQAIEAIRALTPADPRPIGHLLANGDGQPLTGHLNRWLKPHGLTPHDLRRFLITGYETLSAPQRIIDDLVGHSPGKVRGAYTEHINLEATWPWVKRFEEWLGP